jgi:hypothetical protein
MRLWNVKYHYNCYEYNKSKSIIPAPRDLELIILENLKTEEDDYRRNKILK